MRHGPSAQADITFSKPRIHSPGEVGVGSGCRASYNRNRRRAFVPNAARAVGAGRHRVFIAANSFAGEVRAGLGDPHSYPPGEAGAGSRYRAFFIPQPRKANP
jgi:hypothetical protein